MYFHRLSRETFERRLWTAEPCGKKIHPKLVSSVKSLPSVAYARSMHVRRSFSSPRSTDSPNYCLGFGHRTWSAKQLESIASCRRKFRHVLCSITVLLFLICGLARGWGSMKLEINVLWIWISLTQVLLNTRKSTIVAETHVFQKLASAGPGRIGDDIPYKP
jgi:hypothetical protein